MKKLLAITVSTFFGVSIFAFEKIPTQELFYSYLKNDADLKNLTIEAEKAQLALEASQIDIKYRINQNDNLLVKAQAIVNMYSVHLPKEEIIKASGLFGDVTTVTKKWEIEDAKAKEQGQRSTETINVTETNNGNNSQE